MFNPRSNGIQSEEIMCVQTAHSFGSDQETARAVLKAALFCWDRERRAGWVKPPLRAFVTVSRQPGAGGRHFSQRLVERLNSLPCGDWTAWDHQLFSKVLTEHALEKQVIEALEQQPLDWLDDFVQGISKINKHRPATEFFAYERIALTIRVLATAGHTILVGRGSQFATAGLAGGIHVRLVAPLENRVKCVANKFNLSFDQAATNIADAEQRRKIFYRRYWPGREIAPESFAITLNTAELSLDELVECVLPLVRMRDGVAAIGRNCEGHCSREVRTSTATSSAE